MNREIRKVLILVFAIVFCAKAFASDDSINADRPGTAEGTHAVTPGNIYVEMGYQYSFRDEFKFSSVPLTNLRFGLVNRVEMFVFWDGLGVLHSDKNTEISLPGIGAKYRLVMADDFNLTLFGAVEFSNDDEFSAAPALAMVWDYELNDDFEIFGTILSQFDGDDFEYLFVLGLEYGVTDKTGIFAEYYFTDLGTGTDLFHGTEYGLTYLLTNDIQLDVYGGYGFSKEIEHYLGFGIAKRF